MRGAPQKCFQSDPALAKVGPDHDMMTGPPLPVDAPQLDIILLLFASSRKNLATRAFHTRSTNRILFGFIIIRINRKMDQVKQTSRILIYLKYKTHAHFKSSDSLHIYIGIFIYEFKLITGS